MRKRFSSILAMMLIVASAATAVAASQPPQAGNSLPEMKLNKPADSAELKYLGLSGSGTFSVEDVKAQAIILQVFSMYCPYCQKDAPNVNRLYGLIENNPALKGKIKIIGIGAGNSPFEVATFKKKYKIEFALTSDADFKIHKIMGEVRTPYFIVAKMSGPKKPEVVYSRLGTHESVDAFLAEVVRLADVK